MLLLSHIIVALAGLGLGTYSYFKPSKAGLYATYMFGMGTLVSGSFLLVSQPSHIMSACLVGLIYFALLGVIVLGTRQRLKAAAQ